MKLLKFYLKYYLFRSIRKVENIERVIRSLGFRIYEYDPLETKGDMVKFLSLLGCLDYSKDKKAFTYWANGAVNRIVFTQEGFNDDDRRTLLFHEAAHIWYDHLHITGFTDQSDIQQEVTANLFERRLRILKGITYAVFAVLICAVFGFFA